jgi:hypothetical protein
LLGTVVSNVAIPVAMPSPYGHVVGHVVRAARTRREQSHHRVRRVRQADTARLVDRDDRGRAFLVQQHESDLGKLAHMVRAG